MNTNTTFNPEALCSRKVWRIVAGHEHLPNLDEQGLRSAIEELAERRTYLIELERLGKLNARH
jgi:hypothetical protein